MEWEYASSPILTPMVCDPPTTVRIRDSSLWNGYVYNGNQTHPYRMGMYRRRLTWNGSGTTPNGHRPMMCLRLKPRIPGIGMGLRKGEGLVIIATDANITSQIVPLHSVSHAHPLPWGSYLWEEFLAPAMSR